ncbi:anti-sigma factor [Cellulosimicrobium marinum]|uniref:anti-sigma factor n=1 Tax=Cellulosimicrobium marinum TaxID=1638992 RepID=UPI001E5C924E|nr:anti-sigma factor [Cellulosimicrobium marinum]MCB7136269.1 anti-sigma factor [Cellulosimicrobium marinum]
MTEPRTDRDERGGAWDLLPAYALDAVDDLERRAVERLLDADPDARRAVDEYRDVVAAFAVEQAPPAAAREVVLARVAVTPQGARAAGAEETAGSEGPVGPGRPEGPADARARRRWGLVAAAAAAVVAVAVPTTVAVRATQEQTRLQEQADVVAQMLADPSATIVRGDVAGGGEASVLVAGDDYLFRASGLPGVADDQDYQLWVVSDDGAVSSAGVVEDQDGTVEQLVRDVPGVGVAVTVEPEGGSEQPTSDPVVALVT